MQGVGPFCETPSPRSSNLSGLVRSEKNLYDEKESRKTANRVSQNGKPTYQEASFGGPSLRPSG